MTATVQIILPGLFDLPLEELETDFLESKLPHLNRILRLATPRPNQSYSIDEIMITALGFEPEVAPGLQSGLPMAQAFADNGDHEPGRVLLSKAVHLEPGLHSVVIVPIPNNEENLKDITNIINDLNSLFNVDCYLTVITDELFLVHLKGFEAPTHYPHILSVLGKIANPYIEQSRQTLPWYKLLNEIQMFMHQHEINQQRLQRGLLSINSLWCWGAGSLPSRIDTEMDWICDDPILNQFARSLGLAPRPCADIDTLDYSRDALLIDLRLLESLKTGEVIELDELLLEVDRNLLEPLLSGVGRNRTRLVLRAGFEFDFELKPISRIKFWRRQSNLTRWSGYARDA